MMPSISGRNGPRNHSRTWRPYRPTYTHLSWTCFPRIAATGRRSTKPCGGINATGAKVERRPRWAVPGWRDTPRKPPTASILRLSAREERLVHLALDPRYFEQADNRDRDHQGERDEVLRNHGHSVVPLRMCAADVGRPDGFTRFCIKAIKAGAQAERRPPMALHHSRTQLRPREVKPSDRD